VRLGWAVESEGVFLWVFVGSRGAMSEDARRFCWPMMAFDRAVFVVKNGAAQKIGCNPAISCKLGNF
jgi:hypothetical protein